MGDDDAENQHGGCDRGIDDTRVLSHPRLQRIDLSHGPNVPQPPSPVVAAGANGWIDEQAVALEHLTSIKRAGADMILTYLAGEIAELLS